MAEISESKKWFTAKELAGLRLPGLARSKRKINARASRENWTSRDRKGNGGGREFPFEALPESARIALAQKRPDLFGIVAGSGDTSFNMSMPPPDPSHEKLWRRYSDRPDREKVVAEERLRVINRILDLEIAGFKRTAAVNFVSGEIGISPSTLYNWIGMIEGFDRPDWLPALMGKWRGCEVEAECTPDAWNVFIGDYLRLESPAATACYDRLKRIAKEEKWTVPSLKTFLRRLGREIPREAIVLARNGKKALDRMYPSQVRDKSLLHALEIVNADGHRFDLFVKWPDETIARPVGLFYQDVYSGKILAFRIDKTENKDLIRLAFADLVENFGIPQEIFLDNSRSFASKWLTGGVKNRYRFKVRSEEPTGILVSLGCKIHWTKPYHGQSKPIERAFRDLCEYVSKHPRFVGAYTGNSPVRKPENYNSRAIDLDIFLKVLDQEIKAHNAREGRRSPICVGRSFDEVFLASYSQTPIRKATKEQRGLLLLAAEEVKPSKYDGSITLDGNRYWSEKLSGHAEKKMIMRIDPQNLHAGAFVYDSDNSFVCCAECVQPVGFKNSLAAREDARLRRHNTKATKGILENERHMNALQVAAMLPEGVSPEIPSPKVIEGLFGEKFEARRKEKDELEESFEAAMGNMDDLELRKIDRRFAANP